MPALRKVPPQVVTVLGPVHPGELGTTDAHNHLWIDVVQGSEAGSPVLNSPRRILTELQDYGREGGTSMLDCQPGGYGRNASRLVDLSRDSGVRIVACTGFHRRRYYSADHWLWRGTAEQTAQNFMDERPLIASTRLVNDRSRFALASSRSPSRPPSGRPRRSVCEGRPRPRPARVSPC